MADKGFLKKTAEDMVGLGKELDLYSAPDMEDEAERGKGEPIISKTLFFCQKNRHLWIEPFKVNKEIKVKEPWLTAI
ncbi:MAG: hypothetical protein BA867_08530 [Desulfobacterales bacterium S5133MH16]|nr:MAG: hypothetical protein BA867_08530 [Desulfobacterales bacterium S5133MH16]